MIVNASPWLPAKPPGFAGALSNYRILNLAAREARSIHAAALKGRGLLHPMRRPISPERAITCLEEHKARDIHLPLPLTVLGPVPGGAPRRGRVSGFRLSMPAARADEKVIATVNGKALTETDMKQAEQEIGQELGSLPEPTKRRVLIEFLIENQLFAEAAAGEKLGEGAGFESRMQYWKRRALREAYFDNSIKSAVGEDTARKYYEEQVKQLKPEEEVQARHILVDTKEKAEEIIGKIKAGGDFAALAKENSKDPGSKEDGGMLGFFGRNQMVPEFEKAAFELKKGEISAPVQSQFGWHVIKVEDRREKKPPSYEAVKDRLIASLIHKKAQEIATNLRTSAKVDYVDPEIKKQIEEQAKTGKGPRVFSFCRRSLRSKGMRSAAPRSRSLSWRFSCPRAAALFSGALAAHGSRAVLFLVGPLDLRRPDLLLRGRSIPLPPALEIISRGQPVRRFAIRAEVAAGGAGDRGRALCHRRGRHPLQKPHGPDGRRDGRRHRGGGRSDAVEDVLGAGAVVPGEPENGAQRASSSSTRATPTPSPASAAWRPSRSRRTPPPRPPIASRARSMSPRPA